MAKTVKANKVNKANKANKKIIQKSDNKTAKKEDKISLSSIASKKQKKKINLLKLCSIMNKYGDDANDKEIIKRFKTTILSSVSEDISKNNLSVILKRPEDVKMSDFSESLQPYIKHYLFMFNRSNIKKRIK